MKTYHAGKSQTLVSNGLVCIIARFDTDSEVYTCLSPEAARFTARQLMGAADEADEWEAPDAEDLRQDAADDELDERGVVRVQGAPPEPRKSKAKGETP